MGYGLAINSISKKFKITDNLGYVGLIGVLFLIIYAYLSSIFIHHGQFHNSIILIIGLIFFVKFYFLNSKKKKEQWTYFFIIFLILLMGAFFLKTHDDFPYYHFSYSHYLTENSLIFGMGHFNLGYRTPSSIFYLNSLFYLPFVKYFMFHMPAILIMGFSNLVLLIKLKKNIANNQINFITYFTLLVLIFINIFFYRISEHGTDKSAMILIFLLFIEIMLLSNFKINISNQISKIYILIGLIISLKAFYILYGIFFLVILNHLLRNFNIIETSKKFFFNPFFIFAFVIFSLVIFNNFITSGCLIYPVQLTCLQPIWAISLEEVSVLNDWYEQWSKAGAGPNFRVENPSEYIQYFNWVNNWMDMYFFNKVSDFLWGLTLLSLIMYYTFKSKKIIKIKKRKVLLILTIIFILLFEWFYNHPALRYGGYCLIASIFFIAISLLMEKFSISKEKLIKRTKYLIAITILVFISRNINRINYEVKTYGYQPFKVTYYDIKPVFFDNAKRIKILIDQYEECNVNKKNCDSKSDLKMKKLFGKYVIYNE
tara:strand:- start:3002 stop:4624 length:1623 start_codon:yes stop_codon:yes gene_type:complete